MTNLLRTAALFGLLLVSSQANAAVSNRAECYDVVIAHCNTTNHPQECAKGGMDQCDVQFPKVKIVTPRNPLSLRAG